MLQFTQKDIDRFWSKIDKTPNPNGCWIWIAGKDKDGYGFFKLNGKTIRAHRFSYEIHYGKIPNGLNVLHHCDNPTCIRPHHLFLGTCQDNSNDMKIKNRQAKGSKHGSIKHPERLSRGDKHYWHLHPEIKFGEKNPNNKLTNEQVLEIRHKYIPRKYGHKILAKEYNVHPHLIYLILKNKNWKHI